MPPAQRSGPTPACLAHTLGLPAKEVKRRSGAGRHRGILEFVMSLDEGPEAKPQRIGWEFFCKACANEFLADWTAGQTVACPFCSTIFETGWQFTTRGDLIGPWLTQRVVDVPDK